MKKLLNEFYRKNVSDLKKYLQLPEEQQEMELMVELFEQVYGIVASTKYIGNLYVGNSKEDINYKLGKALYNDAQKNGEQQAIKNFKKHFPEAYQKTLKYLKKASKNPIRQQFPDNNVSQNVPSFMYMNYIDDVKNQWLLHFTKDNNNAYQIQNQGFTKGVSDYKKLGLTVWMDDKEKENNSKNKFGFSFDPDDLKRDSQTYSDIVVHRLYGDGIIMFRGSGIKVFHEADKQLQVIFNSQQASNFVVIDNSYKPLEKTEGDMYKVKNKVEEVIYSSNNLMNVVDWVRNNYQQYKNVI